MKSEFLGKSSFFPSVHKAARTGRAGLAQAAVLAARTRWWKNRDESPTPAGSEDAVNSVATVQALAARWEAIQAFLVSGRRAGTRFMRPEGGKREAKLSRLELLAPGQAGVWLALKVAQGGTMSPPGSVLTALCF